MLYLKPEVVCFTITMDAWEGIHRFGAGGCVGRVFLVVWRGLGPACSIVFRFGGSVQGIGGKLEGTDEV